MQVEHRLTNLMLWFVLKMSGIVAVDQKPIDNSFQQGRKYFQFLQKFVSMGDMNNNEFK